MGLRIVFMGTPDFAVVAFAAVQACAAAKGHAIVAAYARPPAKQGRGMPWVNAPLHQAALQVGVPVLTPATLKSADELARFRALEADLAITAAYGMILPPAWLDVPRLGCWNIHASLLPRWRGAAPIQRAIMAGDTQTGITIMQMEAGLDTGPVLLEKRLPIAADDTAASLHDKLAQLGAEAVIDALDDADGLTPVAQAANGITYADKIAKAETRLDFTRPATDLDCHIRGLSPFPGAWFEVEGQRVKVLQARVLDTQGPTGQVASQVAGSETAGAVIYCGQGALELVRVQKAGKAAMSGDDFMRGRGLQAGQYL